MKKTERQLMCSFGLALRRVFFVSATTAILLAIQSGPGRATETSWATEATGSWFSPANWSAGVPTVTDNAYISRSPRANAIVQGTIPATAANLYIQHGGVMVGNIDPGTLVVEGEIAIGTVGNPGKLTVNYGTVSVNTLSVGSDGTYSDTTYGTLELIGDNPTIKMASGVNVVVNSTITGTNGLTKGGIGTLTLAGNNTYSGGTTIAIGTLQIGNGGTPGSLGTGGVLNNGTLAFNRSGTLVVSNLVSGTGSLRQSGSGTVILTADNTYSGGTTISNGTLQIGNGGTTGWTGTGDINNYATLAYNRSDDIVVSNLISGTGSLRQLGSGTLTLTADNTYSGTTVISNGSVQVGDGGTAGSLGTGNVSNHGTLIYDRSDAVTVNNLISGSGSLRQHGSGTLILTANNIYTGATVVVNGTLQVGNGGTSGGLGTGPVSNDGSLVFNRSDTLVVAGAISGTGALTQDGTGTLTLTGTNTYSGQTTINAGTLQIGNGGTTGTLGTGDVLNNGTLAFNRSDTLVVSNLISGTGSLRQSGSGTVTLVSDNTYSGGTLVSAGTLQIGDGGTTGWLGSGDVTNNAMLVFNRGDDIVVSNALSGTGRLVQGGAGTMILTGSNTYSGLTLITNGVLQVGDGGTTGTLGTGNVTNNTTLVFNRSDELVVSNLISGSGTLAQIGAGTLTLAANNNYSGPTAITNGTLQVGNGGFTGALGTNDVFNYGMLIFNRSNSLVVSSTITGIGSVRHAGAGALTLAGTNKFSGGLLIDGGGTIIAHNRYALGDGDVDLANGTLRADPTLTNGLTIAIGGNYTQGADGTVVFRIASPTNFDQLNVAGTVSLNGTGRVASLPGYRPEPNEAFALVVAGGGVSGEFAVFTNDIVNISPLLRQQLLYNTNDVTLKWVQQSFLEYLTNKGVTLTPNQLAVARALDSISSSTDSNDVRLLARLDYLRVLTNDLPPAFDLIAPEELTAMFSAAFAGMDAQGYRFLRRVSELRVDYSRMYGDVLNQYYPEGQFGGQPADESGVPTDVFETPEDKPWNVYAEALTGSGDVGEGDDAGGHDLSNGSVLIGVDRRLGRHFVVGLAGSYNTSEADLANGGKVELDGFAAQVYGVWFNGPWYVAAMLGGGFNSYDTRREAFDGQANGSTDGLAWTALLGAGYDLRYGKWTFSPQAAVQYSSVNVDAFTETGSLSPLRIESQTAEAMHAELGARLRYCHHFDQTLTFLMPEVYLAWRHDFMGDELDIDARFPSGAGDVFTVHGPKQGTGSVVAGIGLSVQWKPSVNTYVNYLTYLGRDGYSLQTVNVGVCISF